MKALRSLVVYLVVLSLAAPAVAWAESGQAAGAASSLHEHSLSASAAEAIAVTDMSSEAHPLGGDMVDFDSCCELGCHIALASTAVVSSTPCPKGATLLSMAAFVLGRGPSGLYRPPRV